MSNTDKLREFAYTLIERVWETGNGDSHECNTRFDDLRNLQNCIDNNLDDAIEKLTALISEGYVEKAKYDEAVRQRDELKEALAEQKRLYFNLFDEEIRCMYCEAEISRGSAIILCKECAENTEL